MYIKPPTVKEYNMTVDKPELSVIIPGIRVKNWINIYNSIISSTHRSFELIIATPYSSKTPPWFQVIPNVKIIQDLGSPVRAQCRAAAAAEGKLLTWISDDGIFVPHGLDTAIDRFYAMGDEKKNILTYKYSEGEKAYSDEYWKINFHRGPNGEGIGSKYIPDDYCILNNPIMRLDYYYELGGFSCSYEGTAMACADFSNRAQNDGAKVELLKGMPILMCRQDNDTAAHSMLNDAQLNHDEPLYDDIYKKPDWQNDPRIQIDHQTEWKKSPTMWSRKYSSAINENVYNYAYQPLDHKMISYWVSLNSNQIQQYVEKLLLVWQLEEGRAWVGGPPNTEGCVVDPYTVDQANKKANSQHERQTESSPKKENE